MTIMNTYVVYDFVARRLVAKYKLDLPSLYSCYERRTGLPAAEKRKMRELFCSSAEEVEALENSGAGTSRDVQVPDLFAYVLRSPLLLKSAYADVARSVCQHIKAELDGKPAPKLYKPLSNPALLRDRVGPRFNDIELHYDDWGQTAQHLQTHTFEPAYSHWVDRFLLCDYIFYAGDGLTPQKIYEIPHYSAIVKAGAICPNADVPSDHLPIAAVFSLAP